MPDRDVKPRAQFLLKTLREQLQANKPVCAWQTLEELMRMLKGCTITEDVENG